MTNIEQLHQPSLAAGRRNWLMLVGNRAVAALIPNSDDMFPHYRWLSVILAESPFDDHGWCSVDFTTLKIAQYDIEQWWHHAARGERYDPQASLRSAELRLPRRRVMPEGQGAKRKLPALPTLRRRACATLRLVAAANFRSRALPPFTTAPRVSRAVSAASAGCCKVEKAFKRSLGHSGAAAAHRIRRHLDRHLGPCRGQWGGPGSRTHLSGTRKV